MVHSTMITNIHELPKLAESAIIRSTEDGLSAGNLFKVTL